jgi:hypothetical protein
MFKGGNKSIFKPVFFFVLMLLLFTSYQADAQHVMRHKLRTSGLVLEGRVYYGWTLDHHIEMTPYKRHYPAFEASLFKATYGRTRWEYMYNYPFIGISYWYSDLGGTKTLGSAHALFPYINFPLLNTKKINLYFRLGVGLGYLTKKYERNDNYDNLAIGSHINGAVNLMVEARARLGSRFMASCGISLVHFSNGGTKQPNYGINMPGISVALAYRLSRENPYLRKKLLPELYPFEFDGKRFLQFDLNAAFGVKDLRATNGEGYQFPVIDIAGNLLWPVGFKSRIGCGADVSYDGSDEAQLNKQFIYPEHKTDIIKTGLNAGYELAFSRMGIMLNLGMALTGLDKHDGTIYEKLALRFGITDNLYTSITLKAYYGKADYIVFGLGYRFRVKYYL